MGNYLFFHFYFFKHRKHLIGTSVKYIRLNTHFFHLLSTPKLSSFCPPTPKTKSLPMHRSHLINRKQHTQPTKKCSSTFCQIFNQQLEPANLCAQHRCYTNQPTCNNSLLHISSFNKKQNKPQTYSKTLS